MNKYITKVFAMSALTSIAAVVGVFSAPSTLVASLIGVALLLINTVGVIVLGYLELKAEFAQTATEWAKRFERLSLSDSAR